MSVKQLLLPVILATIIGIAFGAYTARNTHTAAQETVLEHVQKTGVLRCGYALEVPNLMVDPNTKKVYGVAPDIIERAAEMLGWKVEWTEQVGWSDMPAGLQAGRYDIACVGKWIYAPETKGAEFTMPLFYSAMYAYGRADETRIDEKLGNLNSADFAIATIDGDVNYYMVRDRFSNTRRVEMPAMTDAGQLILNLTTKKVDVIFMAAGEGDDYIKKHPGEIKRLTSKPVTVFDTAFMIKTGESGLAGVLNATIRQMQSDGFINQVLDKYNTSPDAYLRLAKPYQLPN
ncbi:MAG TPA: transporter substrate-binding domain-containing protein [Alphaproteobacteria bacterium]|nr:transporter substrate-binding domain-containing protein [Alphaproteobacteria bacterium]